MTRFAAPIAEQIWDMKYRLKEADGTPIDETVKDAAKWEPKFYAAQEDFKYLPAGRITAGAGTDRSVTLFNCFVMGTIPDTMSGIFDNLKAVGSVTISRPFGPRARWSRVWRRMHPARCPLWTSGTRCAARSCPRGRAEGR